MGKYMKKAKISAEAALMEATSSHGGIRTRAKTLALRRIHASAFSASSCYIQLRNRRLEKLVPVARTRENPRPNSNPNSGPTPNFWPRPASSLKEEVEVEASFGENVLELEEKSSSGSRNSRETTPCSLIRDSETIGTPVSSTRPANSTTTRRIQSSIQRNIPPSLVMEEFFSGPEKVQQKAFAEKYNFDPVKDRPLPGRYEWVKLEHTKCST